MTLTNGNSYAYQWDVGLMVATTEDVGTKRRFANEHGSKAFVVEAVYDEDEDKNVYHIPDILLATGRPVVSYKLKGDDETVVYVDSEDFLPVRLAPKPDNYVFTGDEIRLWEKLDIRLTEAEGDIDDLETAVSALETGKIDEPASEGTAGQFLQTDGAGGRVWASAPEEVFVVTFTESSGTISANKTYLEITAAHYAKKAVIGKYGKFTYYFDGFVGAGNPLPIAFSAHTSISGNTILTKTIVMTPQGGIVYTEREREYIDEPASEGTAGQFLQTDGNGGRSWETVPQEVFPVQFLRNVMTDVISSDKSWEQINQAYSDKRAIVARYNVENYPFDKFVDVGGYPAWVFSAPLIIGNDTITKKSVTMAQDGTITYSEQSWDIGGGGGSDKVLTVTFTQASSSDPIVADKTHAQITSALSSGYVVVGRFDDCEYYFDEFVGHSNPPDIGFAALVDPHVGYLTTKTLRITSSNSITYYENNWEPSGVSDYDDLTDKPQINSVTLSGDLSSSDLGLADANHTHSQYITQETDPTVPSWAKASTKPTYTASEVGAIPEPAADGTAGQALVTDGSGGRFWQTISLTGLPDVFVATYNTTTIAELDAARSAGKKIFLGTSDGVLRPLTEYSWSPKIYSFISGEGDGDTISIISCKEIGNTTVWSNYRHSYLWVYTPYGPPSNGDVLTYNSTGDYWYAGAISLSASDVGAIAEPSSPTSGQFLSWNGSAWVATSLPVWDGSVT